VNPKLLGVLLAYPEAPLIDALPELRKATAGVPRGERRSLQPFLDAVESTPLSELQRAYVETFDFDRRCGLHLTYHVHGDRRQRGLELVRLKRRYAEAGVPLEGSELPDYLPVVLEFTSLRPDDGRELLTSFRGVLELIRSALHDRESLYAGVLDALCAALPQPSAAQLREMQRLAEEGPPAELVGLESFDVPAPAEVVG